jgi:hypothetical protein
MLAGGFQSLVKNIMSIDDKLHLHACNSLIGLARRSLSSAQFRLSFPRFILMETNIFGFLIDLIYIYLPERTPSSQMRAKMYSLPNPLLHTRYFSLLENLLECYNPKDEMMQKFLWKSSPKSKAEKCMNLFLYLLQHKKLCRQVFRALYRWSARDNQVKSPLENTLTKKFRFCNIY